MYLQPHKTGELICPTMLDYNQFQERELKFLLILLAAGAASFVAVNALPAVLGVASSSGARKALFPGY